MPTAIWLTFRSRAEQLSTATVQRFYSEERLHAFQTVAVGGPSVRLFGGRIAKVDSAAGLSLLDRLSQKTSLGTLVSKLSADKVYYQEACRYWLKSSTYSPRFVRNGLAVEQPHGRILWVRDRQAAGLINCVLNSSLFYWYYSTLSDCEHVNDSLVRGFPLPLNWEETKWEEISNKIDARLSSSSTPKRIKTEQGHVIEYDEINGKAARQEIDAADLALGRAFAMSESEIDYFMNYDIKYRIGQESNPDD